MNHLRFFVGLLALGGAISTLACEAPMEVDIPQGDVATLDEMLAAQSGVKEYMAAMDEYLGCLDEEMEALGEEATEEERADMVDRYNTSVTQMEETAAEFNAQRQLYQETAAAEN